MERYNRHIILKEIGREGQSLINRSRVLVVGAGGLGCPVLQYLAAAGVGKLGIVDFDKVEESNLQRQILFGSTSLGQNKALAARARLLDLNPTIEIIAYPHKLDRENAIGLFNDYDIIVDGTDRIPTRYLINDAALFCNRPVVYGAIYKFEGQVAVFNYREGPTYRCLFPEPPIESSIANCSEVGVLGVLPGIIGTMQANEVIKIILKKEGVLRGKLLCYQALSGQSVSIQIPNTSQKWRQRIKLEGLPEGDPDHISDIRINSIELDQAMTLKNVQFVDVRDHGEQPVIEWEDCWHIPLDQLKGHTDRFRESRPYVLFCSSGVRSRQAIMQLKKMYDHDFYNLTAGAQILLDNLKTTR